MSTVASLAAKKIATNQTKTQRQQRKNPFYATLNQLKTRLKDGAAKPDLNAEKNSGQAVKNLVLEQPNLVPKLMIYWLS